MIRCVFERSRAVRIAGHAGYAAHGDDIVCAAITSAFQLCANGITEVLRVGARVNIGSDAASIMLLENASPAAEAFLDALKLHLTILQEQYPDNIEIMEDEIND